MHYELNTEDFQITVTKQIVENDVLCFGKYWSFSFSKYESGTEVKENKCSGFLTKREAENNLIIYLKEQRII